MIWLRNLEDLLYLTTYVTTIWTAMCILLLVIIKLFKYPIVSNPFKVLNTNSVEPNEHKDKSAQNCSYRHYRSCSGNIREVIQIIYNLSQTTYTFSIPLIIPLIYIIVFLIVLAIPFVNDINRLLYTMIFVATGITIYFVFLWPDKLSNFVRSINVKIMIVTQKIFFVCPMK